MKCPAHSGAEMQLITVGRPHFAVPGGDDDETRESRERLIWKCPVPGCPRVAAYMPDEIQPIRRKCHKCRVNYADPDIPGCLVVCRECYRARNKRNTVRTTARRRNARAAQLRAGAAGTKRGCKKGVALIRIKAVAWSGGRKGAEVFYLWSDAHYYANVRGDSVTIGRRAIERFGIPKEVITISRRALAKIYSHAVAHFQELSDNTEPCGHRQCPRGHEHDREPLSRAKRRRRRQVLKKGRPGGGRG